MTKKRERWVAKFAHGILSQKEGMAVLCVRREHGKYMPASEAPDHVKQFFDLESSTPKTTICRSVHHPGDLYAAEEAGYVVRVTRRAKHSMKYIVTADIDKPKPKAHITHICKVSIDDPDVASRTGIDEEGYAGYTAYWDACEGPDGWYVTIVQDWPTVIWDALKDDGPYPTYEAAMEAGRDFVFDLFYSHGLKLETV